MDVTGNCTKNRAADTELLHDAKLFGRGRGHSPLIMYQEKAQRIEQRVPNCFMMPSCSEEGAGTAR